MYRMKQRELFDRFLLMGTGLFLIYIGLLIGEEGFIWVGVVLVGYSVFLSLFPSQKPTEPESTSD
jgi:Zn-dependent membrane protease YugP